jgi:hypothetical protein
MSTGNFCECCDESVFVLANRSVEERILGIDNQGMKEVLISTSLDDLGTKGKELVDWCIDFLLFQMENRPLFFKKFDQSGPHKDKYITIWSFIYSFLGIPEDSGYDYWLLSFLEWNGFMEHDGGIRCGWLDTSKSIERKLTEERKQIIIDWAENCSDEV